MSNQPAQHGPVSACVAVVRRIATSHKGDRIAVVQWAAAKQYKPCSFPGCPCYFDANAENEYDFCGLHRECGCGLAIEQRDADMCEECADLFARIEKCLHARKSAQ